MDLVLFLSVILAMTAASDLISNRIPNWLTFPTILLGITSHTYVDGWQGLVFSLEGLILGMGLLLLPYITGGMGAGDVKLMGVVGVILGPKGVLSAFLFTGLLGGIYLMAILIVRRRFIETLERYGTMFKTFMSTTRFVYIAPAKGQEISLCYGVVIGLGTLISHLTTSA